MANIFGMATIWNSFSSVPLYLWHKHLTHFNCWYIFIRLSLSADWSVLFKRDRGEKIKKYDHSLLLRSKHIYSSFINTYCRRNYFQKPTKEHVINKASHKISTKFVINIEQISNIEILTIVRSSWKCRPPRRRYVHGS